MMSAYRKKNRQKPPLRAAQRTNISWGLATLGLETPPLFEIIACASLQRIGEFEAQNISNVAWAFATLLLGLPPCNPGSLPQSKAQSKTATTR